MEPQVKELWDRHRKQLGHSSMKDFIAHCVNSTIFPIANTRDGLEGQLREFETMLHTTKTELGELISQRDSLLDGHGLKMPTLESRVIDYLTRSGKSNEYLMAAQLQEQSSTIYHVCAKLKNENRVKLDEKGNWYL